MFSLNTPLGSEYYEVIRTGNTYQVKLKRIDSGTFFARATATESSFYTFYEFTMTVDCIANCEL